MAQHDDPQPEAESVTVIICAYTTDRWDILREAIASVRNQTRQPDEILIVIDHNTELAERLRRVEYGVRVVESAEQQGLSGARNHGVTVSTGSIVAFLDDDAVADPDWLEELLCTYREGVAGVGGMIRPRWTGSRPRFFPREFDWIVGCSYQGMPETSAAVRNLIGANMSFRRQVFDRSGLFRTDLGRIGTLPLGCEETDLCIRDAIGHSESTFIYQPRAAVEHLVPSGRQNPKYFYRRCYSEGLSKAAVVRQSGAQRGLASEASHVTKTLPRGVLTGLGESFADRTVDGALRATTIVLGLGVTIAGYLVGTVRGFRSAPSTPIAPTEKTVSC